MTYFKNIKRLNCILDFKLTHKLTVEVMLSSNAFLEEVNHFFSLTGDIAIESASKYVAGKHRILTTMNSSVGHVIYIVIVLFLPVPSV